MKTTKIEITQDKFGIKYSDNEEELSQLGFSFTKGAHYTTVIGQLDIDDLKILRKLIRKEIKRINENH